MPARRTRSDVPPAAAAAATAPATASTAGPYASHAGPRDHGSQLDVQLKDSGAPASSSLQFAKGKLPEGEEGFEDMWDVHPHMNSDSDDENTSSDDVREEEGLPDYLANTCAIRLSVMLNKLGDAYKITPRKTAAAGLPRRPTYSKKSKSYYIVAASEMWTYLAKHFRKADAIFPKSGKWKTEEEFTAAFEDGDSPIKDLVGSKKGIVAFERIFGYSGTGHVDLFDGNKLSDSSSWYPCKRLHLWYIVA
ncbi:MAG: hypothetical protein GY898_31510 [Proteobacteria bacterium]|nr:hypothetical protein [Pseudomonadota bacterium]